MCVRSVGVVTVLALGFFLLASARASTVTKVLGDSGWSAQYDNTEISLTLLNPPADANDVQWVVLEKVAQFTDASDSFDIKFMQNNALATQFIVIDQEVVFNNTDKDWTDFHFSIVDDLADSQQGGAKFDAAQSAGFDVSPFTNKQFANGDTELNVSGGTVPNSGNGNEWTPGQAHGSLFIDGNPFDSGGMHRSFTFREHPTTSVIPLPAAGWTALSGLLGLGAIGSVKSLRRKVG